MFTGSTPTAATELASPTIVESVSGVSGRNDVIYPPEFEEGEFCEVGLHQPLVGLGAHAAPKVPSGHLVGTYTLLRARARRRGQKQMALILFVEYHSTFRQAASYVIDQEPDLEVVAQGGSVV